MDEENEAEVAVEVTVEEDIGEAAKGLVEAVISDVSGMTTTGTTALDTKRVLPLLHRAVKECFFLGGCTGYPTTFLDLLGIFIGLAACGTCGHSWIWWFSVPKCIIYFIVSCYRDMI
jgi:hypothetical protein